MVLDAVDGGDDEDGLIGNDARVNVFGERALDFGEAFLNVSGGGDGIFAGLLGDDEGDGRDAIKARRCGGLFIAVFGIADIANLDDVAVAIGDGDFVELLRAGDASVGA